MEQFLSTTICNPIRILDWRKIEKRIPSCFIDDGPSSPFRILYGVIYNGKQQAVIYRAARIHDWLYWYGRLEGSFTERLTRAERDAIYRDVIAAHGYKKIAALHHWALTRMGGGAWQRAARRMSTNGDFTYQIYLGRKVAEGELAKDERDELLAA